jgi:hypothetical protein
MRNGIQSFLKLAIQRISEFITITSVLRMSGDTEDLKEQNGNLLVLLLFLFPLGSYIVSYLSFKNMSSHRSPFRMKEI